LGDHRRLTGRYPTINNNVDKEHRMKKVALITGASSGIGRELAWIHAEHGNDLVIVARREQELQKLAREIAEKHGTAVRVIAKDLALASAPQEIYDEVIAAGIQVDYLINNAGFGLLGKFVERDLQATLAMVHVNITALTSLTHLFVPPMVARGHGHLLNVASVAGLMPGGPLQSVYFATKAFVISLTSGLSEELRDTGVVVTALCPGPTETEFAQAAQMQASKVFANAFSARSVAEAGYDAMEKGELIRIAGVPFGQKIMIPIMPLLPRAGILAAIRKTQEAW
jgi:short-subunit dehydrogenase